MRLNGGGGGGGVRDGGGGVTQLTTVKLIEKVVAVNFHNSS